MLMSILFIALSVFVLFTGYLYVNQSAFIYFPYSKIDSTPAQSGLNYRDIYLTTEDQMKIHGWYLPLENPRATLLFFHGNGGNISHRLDKLEIFNELGFSVLIIDYDGYGLSEGGPSESGTYQDAEAAWKYLTDVQKINTNKIIIYGESLGGAVATWLATQHDAGALILDSTFTSIYEMGKRYYPFLPLKLISRIKYPTIDRISHINCPLLIIHSSEDDIVPFEMGKKLFEHANQPKDFLQIHGDHNYGFMQSREQYYTGFDHFILTHFYSADTNENTGSD